MGSGEKEEKHLEAKTSSKDAFCLCSPFCPSRSGEWRSCSGHSFPERGRQGVIHECLGKNYPLCCRQLWIQGNRLNPGTCFAIIVGHLSKRQIYRPGFKSSLQRKHKNLKMAE